MQDIDGAIRKAVSPYLRDASLVIPTVKTQSGGRAYHVRKLADEYGYETEIFDADISTVEEFKNVVGAVNSYKKQILLFIDNVSRCPYFRLVDEIKKYEKNHPSHVKIVYGQDGIMDAYLNKKEPKVAPPCICDTKDLFNFGCRCGHFHFDQL